MLKCVKIEIMISVNWIGRCELPGAIILENGVKVSAVKSIWYDPNIEKSDSQILWKYFSDFHKNGNFCPKFL